MRKLFFSNALTPEGWRPHVAVTVADGTILSVESGADPAEPGIETVPGHAIPGMGNIHSHAFQRGMAGLGERASPPAAGPSTEGGATRDSFWSWREVMYRFLERLTPEDVEAVAALAYMEMLEAGFTGVAEFHYLHHQPGGLRYGEIARMSAAIARAAAETGIALTLLPVLYVHGGFNAAPTGERQRRFLCDLDEYARLLEGARAAIASLPDARLGIAPHSLRGVNPAEFKHLPQLIAAYLAPVEPVHIHIAEQVKEVRDCEAALGARPVRWLLDNAEVDPRWCLVHATHLDDSERRGIAASGAVAGLCPITEANLGDGIFPAVNFLAEGGRFAIGSDSNVLISAAEELRVLEYGQRLRDLGRNRLAATDGGFDGSTGARLFTHAAATAAGPLGRKVGAIAPGHRADIVTLDPEHPSLAGRGSEVILDGWIFAAAGSAVDHVLVGGEIKVAGGRHLAREAVRRRWSATARRLIAA